MNDDRRAGDEPAADELTARLDRLGSEEVEVPDARLDAVWSRAVALHEHADDERRPGAVALIDDRRPAGQRSSRMPRLAVAAASMLVVVALSVFLFGRGDDALVVAAAQDVVVVVPGEEPVAATDGTELRDGTILEVDGFVEVGERRYGPGRYRVSDGTLVQLEDDESHEASTGDGNADIGTGDEPVETTVDLADETTRPPGTTPGTTAAPAVDEPVAPPSTRPADTQPVDTTPGGTTPSRTTVPDRIVIGSTVPEPTRTTAPTTTRPAEEPPVTVVRTTTVERPTTTTTAPTTTSPEVRRRPVTEESSGGDGESQTR